MRTFLAVVVAVVLGCTDSASLATEPVSPVSPVRDGPPTISFVNASRGDVVRVRYRSRGCFASHDIAFEFTPTSRGASLWGEVLQSSLAEGVKLIIQPSVSVRQLAGLERLLGHYRDTSRADGCTTREHVTIELVRNGQSVVREEYVDASCAALSDENMVGFWSLLSIDRSGRQ